MKQKMTRFLNHENLENQLILLRKNHMISSNLPTKIREEPLFFSRRVVFLSEDLGKNEKELSSTIRLSARQNNALYVTSR